MIHFDMPQKKSNIIKVLGFGGGGGNAVNHMFTQNIKDVDFIVCNTDAQALAQCTVPNKIQLGPNLTSGLGAGADPTVGRRATEESLEEIRRLLETNTKMVFITAGMGGGTGTGGAPIVARICRDLNILTVGIVTTPFGFEGPKRMQQAQAGVNELKEHVDTLLVISNDKLRHEFGNLRMSEAFAKADEVLSTAAKCITDIIIKHGRINVDFADVGTVMKNGGVAMLGRAEASGQNRALTAIEAASNSPLLNDNDINGAKWILLNITTSNGEFECTMDEMEEIQNFIKTRTVSEADVIFGVDYDDAQGDKISITLIATGFNHKDPFSIEEKKKTADPVVVHVLNTNATETSLPSTPATDNASVQPAATKSVAEQVVPVSEEVHYSTEPYIEQPATKSVSTADEQPLYFQLSTDVHDPHPSIIQQNDQLAPQKVTQNGFLNKPEQVYSHGQVTMPASNMDGLEPDLRPVMQPNKVQKNEAFEGQQLTLNEGIPSVPMQQSLFTEEQIQSTNTAQEDPQSLIAKERMKRLRGLSYNPLNIDDHEKLDSVPAYKRRNVDLQNTLSSVEDYYSGLARVNVDDKNQPSISTTNSFLHGKKPD